MDLLSKNRTIDADLKEITLLDILNKFKQENFFTDDEFFHLIEAVDENHLIFGVHRDKITPGQIHEFKYFEEKKEIEVKSTYRSIFFPGLLIYMFPLSILFSADTELMLTQWKEGILLFLGITFFIGVFAFTSLKDDSKNIEREISIRLNYLLREKGYPIKLG